MNRIFTAAEAQAWGFVNWVVADAELAQRTADIANELANAPTLALGACKRLVFDGVGRPFEAQLEDEAVAIVRVAGSDDVDEGCRAFREKRRARFKGC